MKRISILFGMLALATIGASLFAPVVAFAQDPSLWPTGYWGPILTCHGTGCDFCHMLRTFQNLAYVLLSIGIFAIAPVMIIWGGFRIMTAGASPEGVSAGKRILTATVIGIAIGLGAFLIVNTVVNILNAVNSGAGDKIWNAGVIQCTPGQIPGLPGGTSLPNPGTGSGQPPVQCGQFDISCGSGVDKWCCPPKSVCGSSKNSCAAS